MLKRRRPVEQAEFEAELSELGQTLWTPATPDIRSQIQDTLRSRAAAQSRSAMTRERSLRPVLACALLFIIGVVIAFAAIPSARAQMAAWLGIGPPQIGVHVIAVNNAGPVVLSARGYGEVSVGCGK